jgi:hypothetical protein
LCTKSAKGSQQKLDNCRYVKKIKNKKAVWQLTNKEAGNFPSHDLKKIELKTGTGTTTNP